VGGQLERGIMVKKKDNGNGEQEIYRDKGGNRRFLSNFIHKDVFSWMACFLLGGLFVAVFVLFTFLTFVQMHLHINNY